MGENRVKRSNLKRITLKKSKTLLKRVNPVVLKINTTFAPFALYLNSGKRESLRPLFK